jgi:hypothetical protein
MAALRRELPRAAWTRGLAWWPLVPVLVLVRRVSRDPAASLPREREREPLRCERERFKANGAAAAGAAPCWRLLSLSGSGSVSVSGSIAVPQNHPSPALCRVIGSFDTDPDTDPDLNRLWMSRRPFDIGQGSGVAGPREYKWKGDIQQAQGLPAGFPAFLMNTLPVPHSSSSKASVSSGSNASFRFSSLSTAVPLSLTDYRANASKSAICGLPCGMILWI